MLFTSSTDVYLSLNGEVIPNHGYVEISDIGSSDITALLCHTDRPADSIGNSGLHQMRIEWEVWAVLMFQDLEGTEVQC